MKQEPIFMAFDNFFADPDAVRAEALSRSYETPGQNGGSAFPSQKTLPENMQYQMQIKEHIERVILGRPITIWPGEYNTCWQYSVEGQLQPIHHDHGLYSAVVYMTPDADVSAGTGLYRHKETGISYWDEDDPATSHVALNTGPDDDTWEQVAFIGNVYNRLIVFNAQHYHKGTGTFGTNKYNGRLYCTFFFS
jgi:hypothetical protein